MTPFACVCVCPTWTILVVVEGALSCSGSLYGFYCRDLRGSPENWPKHRIRTCLSLRSIRCLFGMIRNLSLDKSEARLVSVGTTKTPPFPSANLGVL